MQAHPYQNLHDGSLTEPLPCKSGIYTNVHVCVYHGGRSHDAIYVISCVMYFMNI